MYPKQSHLVSDEDFPMINSKTKVLTCSFSPWFRQLGTTRETQQNKLHLKQTKKNSNLWSASQMWLFNLFALQKSWKQKCYCLIFFLITLGPCLIFKANKQVWHTVNNGQLDLPFRNMASYVIFQRKFIFYWTFSQEKLQSIMYSPLCRLRSGTETS